MELRSPQRPTLTCYDPASSTCNPRIDAARLLDYEQTLEHYVSYVDAVCGLTGAKRWPALTNPSMPGVKVTPGAAGLGTAP